MASTTTNLGLMKPAYSDDADISDINGNMDLIDAEAGRVRANVAANYDSSETYAVGDYCLHDGSLYKCTTAISSPEAWTAGHWTQIKITGELSALNGNIATLNTNKADKSDVRAYGLGVTGNQTAETLKSANQGWALVYMNDSTYGMTGWCLAICYAYGDNKAIEVFSASKRLHLLTTNGGTSWIVGAV